MTLCQRDAPNADENSSLHRGDELSTDWLAKDSMVDVKEKMKQTEDMPKGANEVLTSAEGSNTRQKAFHIENKEKGIAAANGKGRESSMETGHEDTEVAMRSKNDGGNSVT